MKLILIKCLKTLFCSKYIKASKKVKFTSICLTDFPDEAKENHDNSNDKKTDSMVEHERAVEEFKKLAKESKKSAEESEMSAKESEKSEEGSEKSAEESEKSAKESEKSEEESEKSAEESEKSTKESKDSAKESKKPVKKLLFFYDEAADEFMKKAEERAKSVLKSNKPRDKSKKPLNEGRGKNGTEIPKYKDQATLDQIVKLGEIDKDDKVKKHEEMKRNQWKKGDYHFKLSDDPEAKLKCMIFWERNERFFKDRQFCSPNEDCVMQGNFFIDKTQHLFVREI